MNKDNVIELIQPGEFKDHLTEILRQGARALVLQAVEAEFAAFLESHADEKLEDGRQHIVRHDYLPERKVVTGIGAIPVKVPRSRDRSGHKAEDAIRFFQSCFPRMCERVKVWTALLYLYLKGVSSGDFAQVMPFYWGETRLDSQPTPCCVCVSNGRKIMRTGWFSGWVP